MCQRNSFSLISYRKQDSDHRIQPGKRRLHQNSELHDQDKYLEDRIVHTVAPSHLWKSKYRGKIRNERCRVICYSQYSINKIASYLIIVILTACLILDVKVVSCTLAASLDTGSMSVSTEVSRSAWISHRNCRDWRDGCSVSMNLSWL